MNHNDIATHYRDASARGNHPMALVVKLYDAILEDLRRAMNGADAGDIQGRTASLNHALLVIAELQSVLNHAQGGEVALRLDGFYNVTRALILEANIHSSPAQLQRIIDLYLPLRQAWKQAEQAVSTGSRENSVPQESASPIALSHPQAESADSDLEPAQWNA